MAKRECANLVFTFTDTETKKSLVIGEGGGQYSEIQKNEDTFSALKGFTSDTDEGRTIPIPIYLQSMNDTLFLNNFFNPKKKYDLKILMNNVDYYTQCKADEPDLSECDDLYGDKSKLIVYTINVVLLNNRNYFTTDYVSSKSVGAGIKENFKAGKYFRIPKSTDTGYDFPKFKLEIPNNTELIASENGINNKPYIINLKKIDSNYFLIFKNIMATYDPILLFLISDKDEGPYFFYNYNFINQFFITKDKFYEAMEGEIIFEAITNMDELQQRPPISENGDINFDMIKTKLIKTKSKFKIMGGAQAPPTISIKTEFMETIQQKYPFVLTLRIKNRVLRNQDTHIFGFDNKMEHPYTLTLINNNGIIKLKGDFTALGSDIDGLYFYNPIMENYFNILEDYKNLKATDGITSSSGKAVKFGVTKIIGSEAIIYVFAVAHQDGSRVEEGEIFNFNLIPDKNQYLNTSSSSGGIDNYYFSLRLRLQPVNVLNSGGESNGFILIIRPKQPLLNPKITNLTTGFSMGVNIKANVGDTLEIDTENKSVKLNDTYYQNVKRILDDWLVLEQGSNTVQFSADSGGESAEVTLKYRNKLRGL